MENRDNFLFDLRPSLELAPAASKMELFQNNTLRPILKFQNKLILKTCHHQFVKRKNVYFKLPEKKQLDYIEHQIIADKNFKSLLFGFIIGLFSGEEWNFYQENEQEIRKRMSTMLIQRVQSQQNLLS